MDVARRRICGALVKGRQLTLRFDHGGGIRLPRAALVRFPDPLFKVSQGT